MKKHFLTAVFLCSIFISFQYTKAQTTEFLTTAQSSYKPELSSNILNINPISFLFGSASGNYEHLFNGAHGVFFEGSYSFGKGSSYLVGYHYHFNNDEDNYSIYSSYWGVFILSQKVKTNFKDSDKNENYDIDFKSLNIGINYGTRYSLGGPFDFAWRAGYGFPITADFSWSPKQYKKYKSFESLTKVVSGIDFELSVGIVF